MTTERERPAASEAEPTSVDCHALRFTRERIEKLRQGKRVTSFARKDVRHIRILNDSPSEDPVRETLWGLLLGAGGAALLWRAADTPPPLAGAGLCLVSGLLIWHQLRKTTIVEIQSRDGVIRVAAEGKLSASELAN